MKAEDLIDDFVSGWRKQNNNDAAVYSSYHYDAMIAFAEVYHQSKVNNVVLDDVIKCEKCGSLEMYQYTKTKDKCEDCEHEQDFL
jgi:hypothetical protein